MADRPSLHPAAAALLVGICVLGVGLRVWLTQAPVAPDELANVQPMSFWGLLVDPESAVNPPMTRWLGNLFVPDAYAITVGRVVGTVSSSLMLPVAFLVALRASRSQAAALFATFLLAITPVLVIEGTRFRSYGLWSLAAMVHLLALSHLTEEPDERARRWAMGSAIMMAWTHYLSVPLAMLWIPVLQWGGWVKRAIALWVPAAVSLVPMAFIVFGDTSTRVATSGSVLEGLVVIMMGELVGVPGVPVVYVLVLPIALLMVVWGRLSPTAHTLFLGLVALLVSILLVGQVQFVRSSVATMWFVFAAPLLATAIAVVPWAYGRAGLAVLMGLMLSTGVYERLEAHVEHAPEGGLEEVVERWPYHAELHDSGRLWVYPTWAWTGAHLLLTGHSIRDRVPKPPCVGETCYDVDGHEVRLARDRGGRPGTLVAIEERPEPELVAGCTQVEDTRSLRVWLCEGLKDADHSPP